MKRTCATPAHVGTNVKSVTQSWFREVAVKSRQTRSGRLVATGSGVVVFTRVVRLTPSMPRERMSRAV
jgi:hypothetical protein